MCDYAFADEAEEECASEFGEVGAEVGAVEGRWYANGHGCEYGVVKSFRNDRDSIPQGSDGRKRVSYILLLIDSGTPTSKDPKQVLSSLVQANVFFVLRHRASRHYWAWKFVNYDRRLFTVRFTIC